MTAYNKFTQYIILGSLCLSLASCMSEQESSSTAPRKSANKAYSKLSPTKDNKVTGQVSFTVVPEGVKVVADIDGLAPGKHGIHVHEFGDCSAPDGSSAGAHFNPTHHQHGGPDSKERHVGDLGNIIADNNGHAHYERIDKDITLSGTNNIIGRSVIVHEKADDFTSQPAGDAGKRLACGVIEAKE